MALRGEGLLGEDGEGSTGTAEEVVYMLHPNCAIEEV